MSRPNVPENALLNARATRLVGKAIDCKGLYNTKTDEIKALRRLCGAAPRKVGMQCHKVVADLAFLTYKHFFIC